MHQKIYFQDKLSIFLYEDNILTPEKYQELLDFLETQNFKSGKCISGKPIPRQQIWYHLQKLFFCEAWKYRYDRWKSEECHPILQEVQDIIQKKTQEFLQSLSNSKNLPAEIQYPVFNSCLVNKYRNGQDSIKPHQDSSISFGEYPTISNLSMVSERKMVVRALSRFNDISEKEIEFKLKPNSLFIMAGASQKFFTHSIPKVEIQDKRYSLTFRQHYPYQTET